MHAVWVVKEFLSTSGGEIFNETLKILLWKLTLRHKNLTGEPLPEKFANLKNAKGHVRIEVTLRIWLNQKHDFRI